MLIDEGEKAAIINADMGTGKSIMGVSTAAVMAAEGFSRTLILSPPHLVYKWRREILDTVENATVWILNGSDTLMKLLQLKHSLNAEKSGDKTPEFFILGRVRLRMGFHWKPAFVLRNKYFAACPDCGKFVKDSHENPLQAEYFPTDKRFKCTHCKTPLWVSTRSQLTDNTDAQESLKKSLCKIPTIGKKRAGQLLEDFGEEFIANMLGDNIHQFINLMDGDGKLIFSGRQALRMEKAFSRLEFSFGQGNYKASEFIKRYLPKNYFSLLIVDEGHEVQHEVT